MWAMIISTQTWPLKVQIGKKLGQNCACPYGSIGKHMEIPKYLWLLSSSKLLQYPCLDPFLYHPSFSLCSFQLHVAKKQHVHQKPPPQKKAYFSIHFQIFSIWVWNKWDLLKMYLQYSLFKEKWKPVIFQPAMLVHRSVYRVNHSTIAPRPRPGQCFCLCPRTLERGELRSPAGWFIEIFLKQNLVEHTKNMEKIEAKHGRNSGLKKKSGETLSRSFSLPDLHSCSKRS